MARPAPRAPTAPVRGCGLRVVGTSPPVGEEHHRPPPPSAPVARVEEQVERRRGSTPECLAAGRACPHRPSRPARWSGPPRPDSRTGRMAGFAPDHPCRPVAPSRSAGRTRPGRETPRKQDTGQDDDEGRLGEIGRERRSVRPGRGRFGEKDGEEDEGHGHARDEPAQEPREKPQLAQSGDRPSCAPCSLRELGPLTPRRGRFRPCRAATAPLGPLCAAGGQGGHDPRHGPSCPIRVHWGDLVDRAQAAGADPRLGIGRRRS